jgi:hypothetical protein
MPDQEGLTATMSVAMKVNLGNYESADAFISVAGINEFTTKEEVEALLDGSGRIAYDVLKARLSERVRELRAAKK